jgi:hypothetical protein
LPGRRGAEGREVPQGVADAATIGAADAATTGIATTGIADADAATLGGTATSSAAATNTAAAGDATGGPDAGTARTTATDAVDADVTLALRGMGFKADETRRAMADTAHAPAATFEKRLRSALAELMRPRGFRCSEGPFDLVASRWSTDIACA